MAKQKKEDSERGKMKRGKLIYVPTLHSTADLGSLGDQTQKLAIKTYGKERLDWQQEVILGYWNSVTDYLEGVKIDKIYQDGWVIDCELVAKGNPKLYHKILEDIEEICRKGSQNYQLVSKLIGRGARLKSTEKVELVKEQARLEALSLQLYGLGSLYEFKRAKSQGKKVMEKRDEYIAETINKTLCKGETAVLFVGAEHNVILPLPKDIEIVEVKRKEDLYAFFVGSLTEGKTKKIEELAAYLTSPVDLR